MIKEKEVVVNISHNKQVEYYSKKGYECKLHDRLLVLVEDLQPNSSVYVTRVCDYCGAEDSIMYSVYNRHRRDSVIKKDACKKCGRRKAEEACLATYGVKYTAGLDFVREKAKQTNLQKYGVDHPRKCKEINDKINNTMMERYGAYGATHDPSVMEKVRNTMINKYGYDHPSRVPEINDKRKQTFIEKYGYDNPFKFPDFKEKSIKTSREKYGVDWPMQNEIIKGKAQNTLYNNQTVKTSKGQRKLRDLIGGKLNYPIGPYAVDILWFNGIAVEYDGSGHDMCVIWHGKTKEEFDKRELQREAYLVDYVGLKIIRIINKKDSDIFNQDLLNDIMEKCVSILEDGYDIVRYDVESKQYIY